MSGRHRWSDEKCARCGLLRRKKTLPGGGGTTAYYFAEQGVELYVNRTVPACPYCPDPKRLQTALEASRKMQEFG